VYNKVIIIPQIILMQLFDFSYFSWFSKICYASYAYKSMWYRQDSYAFSMVCKMNWIVFIIRYRFADSTESGLIIIPLS